MPVTFTDQSVLQFGMHKGKKFIDIPASWFLWLTTQPTYDKTTPLGQYIESNMDVLKAQDKADKQLRR